MNHVARAQQGLLVLCLLGTAPAQAQLLGTLFTSPEEREYLDYLRQEFLLRNAGDDFDIQVVEIPEIPADAAAPQAGPEEFTFGGIMTRRDGSRSVWLNGRLLAEDELPEDISIVTGAQTASLSIRQDDGIFVLRPGQTVDLATGVISENFQRRQSVLPENTPATEVPAEDAAAEETEAGVEPEATAVAEETASVTEADGEGNAVDSLADAVMEMGPDEIAALVDALENRRQGDGEESGEESDDDEAEE